MNGVYNMGNIALKAGFYDIGKIGHSGNTGAKMWELGGDYSLSKRTKLYAVYTKMNNDSNAAYCAQGGAASAGFGFFRCATGLPLVSTSTTATPSARKDPSIFSVGHAPYLLRSRGPGPLFLETQTGPQGPVCISAC